jgi:hypothetical protein
VRDKGRGRRPVNPKRFVPPESPTPPDYSRSVSVNENVAERAVVDRTKKQLDRIIADARNGASWHEVHQARWALIHYSLGIPASLLAGVAGGAALVSATNRVFAGFVALASAGVGSVAVTLDSRNHQQRHRNLAAGWSALERDVEFIITFELPPVRTAAQQVSEHSSSENIQKQLERLQGLVKELVDREKELLAGPPVVPGTTAAPAGPVRRN